MREEREIEKDSVGCREGMEEETERVCVSYWGISFLLTEEDKVLRSEVRNSILPIIVSMDSFCTGLSSERLPINTLLKSCCIRYSVFFFHTES